MQNKKAAGQARQSWSPWRKRYRKYHEKYPFLELPVDEATPQFPSTMKSCICSAVICRLPKPSHPGLLQGRMRPGRLRPPVRRSHGAAGRRAGRLRLRGARHLPLRGVRHRMRRPAQLYLNHPKGPLSEPFRASAAHDLDGIRAAFPGGRTSPGRPGSSTGRRPCT